MDEGIQATLTLLKENPALDSHRYSVVVRGAQAPMAV